MDTDCSADFTFCGRDAEECEQFIRWIRKQAFREGKQNDNVWLAHYAATCSDEEALWWYEELDGQTKDDWTLLSRALRQKYVLKEPDNPSDR